MSVFFLTLKLCGNNFLSGSGNPVLSPPCVGIWKEWFVEPMLHPDYYSNISKEANEEWKREQGMNVNESVKNYLLEYLGKPLHQLIRYMLQQMCSLAHDKLFTETMGEC